MAGTCNIFRGTGPQDLGRVVPANPASPATAAQVMQLLQLTEPVHREAPGTEVAGGRAVVARAGVGMVAAAAVAEAA